MLHFGLVTNKFGSHKCCGTALLSDLVAFWPWIEVISSPPSSEPISISSGAHKSPQHSRKDLELDPLLWHLLHLQIPSIRLETKDSACYLCFTFFLGLETQDFLNIQVFRRILNFLDKVISLGTQLLILFRTILILNMMYFLWEISRHGFLFSLTYFPVRLLYKILRLGLGDFCLLADRLSWNNSWHWALSWSLRHWALETKICPPEGGDRWDRPNFALFASKCDKFLSWPRM